MVPKNLSTSVLIAAIARVAEEAGDMFRTTRFRISRGPDIRDHTLAIGQTGKSGTKYIAGQTEVLNPKE